LAQYLPAAVLNLATGAQQTQACLDATETMDSYFRGRFNLPLLAWGNDVTRYTAYVASYLLMTLIGFAPQAGSDQLIVTRYYEAVGYPDRPGSGWAPGVQRQAIQPDVTPSIAIGQNSGVDLPQVSTNPPRGWAQFRNGKPVVGGF
jgi:phage gp36-like protein